MRHLGGLITICAACNQVFELRETSLPPPDAPPACPALGTVPTFRSALRQVTALECVSYNVSTSGRAIAYCYEDGINALYEGPDGQLARAIGLDGTIDHPTISPEGDHVFVRRYDNGYKLSAYRRQSDDSWSLEADLPIPIVFLERISVTRGPERRALVSRSDMLREYVSTGPNMWTELAPHNLSALGVSAIYEAMISPDGLRLIFHTGSLNRTFFYTDRSSPDATFAGARPIAGVPNAEFAFMTEDCGRLYFSGLGGVFYMPQ